MNAYILDKGYFKVSDIHEIYYEVFGNPNGTPILFLHGGPGSGFSDKDKEFFDLKKFKVLFLDQRGAGKSNPFGSIEHNTTQDLVNDINLLSQKVGFDKFHIFGGSWGSTLALVYAIQFPERVISLLLRGIFLGSKKEITHYLNGGVQKEFPEVWKRFSSLVPKTQQHNFPEYYLDKMKNGTPEEIDTYTYEWAFYEISIFKQGITPQETDEYVRSFAYQSLSILEAHYLSNNCFIEDDYILKNTARLNPIPTVIIHGEQDAICPIQFAQQLHNNLAKSKIAIVQAGHSCWEPQIESELRKQLLIISAEAN